MTLRKVTNKCYIYNINPRKKEFVIYCYLVDSAGPAGVGFCLCSNVWRVGNILYVTPFVNTYEEEL